MPLTDQETRERVAHAEALLSELATLPDGPVRAQVTDTLHAVVGLYGECLARVMLHARDARAALAADELVGHLLLVHDLHPDPVETRVRRALEDVRAQGDAELVAVDGPVARVRLRARGCGSSTAALGRAVEDAVTRAAPEIERVETEQGAAPGTLIAVESLFRPGTPAGHEADGCPR
ncbi:NifU family protein [Streptomyces cinnamoneus]|uniref:NifU family protein n=1 Tax=Streptomyces cinnamoneus TaxID=53446 RepID=UPI0037B9DE1C